MTFYCGQHDCGGVVDCPLCVDVVRKQERERIIKLLEDILVGNSNGNYYCYEDGYWGNLYPDVVALINGEQK